MFQRLLFPVFAKSGHAYSRGGGGVWDLKPWLTYCIMIIQASFCVTSDKTPAHTGLYIKKRLRWLTKLKGGEAVPSFRCGWIQSLK